LRTSVSSADWITGSTTAPIVIVEYSDFQCPACSAYHPILKRLLTEHGNEFAFVYRHFPLPQHKNAYASAIAAEAAGKQGKFWEMHDVIFEHQADWQDLEDPTALFTEYAKTLGLSLTQFATDLKDTDGVLHAKAEASLKEGEKTGTQGTPTFFVNGKMIDNPRSYEAFTAILKNKGL
jgi:protein-disulfide isomerase